MSINDLSEMTTTLLAISLASERVVTILKTSFPVFLADEKKTAAQEVDLIADRNRRLLVLLISFVASWTTASFIADTPGTVIKSTFFGSITFGTPENGETAFPVWILGLLASGGSSLWSNLLGYTKAVKDVQNQRRASEGLEFNRSVQESGLTTFDSGVGVRLKMNDTTLDQLTSLTPPSFDSSFSRIQRVN